MNETFKYSTILSCFIFILSANSAFALPSGFINQALISSGLSFPTDSAFLHDGRILITEQGGRIRVFKNGSLLDNPALTIAVGAGGDRGLLSIAVDPNFSSNSYIYLFFTSPSLHQRVSRFSFNPGSDIIDSSSEKILIENASLWGGFLNAGEVNISPDGKLYASFGSNGGGTVAQDLTSLDGKLVRINTDGSIPGDNPYKNTPLANPAIFALGFRNPWRFNFDSNGKAILGDVGETLWEKLVRAAPGANFGWPNFEGDCRPNCGGVTAPIFVNPHNGAGSAIVGGAQNRGTNFPSEFADGWFIGDFVQGTIKKLSFNVDGNVGSVSEFDSGLGALANIDFGPDGCLYYIVIFPGSFHRVCYGSFNAPPNAVASSDKSFGTLPLNVNFSSAGSIDPLGGVLSYNWDFGDGSSSSLPNPSHSYSEKGIYDVKLTVTNSAGSAFASLKIWAGYFPPSVEISNPIANSKYNVGDSIFFSGSANDPQDGQLTDSAFEWAIVFHHNTHTHSPTIFTGMKSGTFIISDSEESSPDTAYEFVLTAKNSAGLAATKSVFIYPNIADIPPPSDLEINAQVLTDKSTYNLSDEVVFTNKVISNKDLANALIDVEIWQDTKINQYFTVTNLTAGNIEQITWSLSGGYQPGLYTFKIGVFSEDWSNLFYWNDSAAQILIEEVTDMPTFIARADLPNSVFPAGSSSALTTQVSSTGDASSLIIDTEIFDMNGNKFAQNVVPANLLKNQIFSSVWNLNLPVVEGRYVVKTGIFSSDWGKLFLWNNDSFEFTIGTPPGPPEPGKIYPIRIITLQDNELVGGIKEIQAVVDGLDINTYNIGWRTGDGQFFNLDTDPLTKSFKHAWIGFSDWNWIPSNIYPLEFEVRDQSNNLIGGALIHIQVAH